MSYEVAINSAYRPGPLCTKTLPMLRDGGVDPHRITVWLASPMQIAEYQPIMQAAGFGNVRIELAPHDPNADHPDWIGLRPSNLGVARNHVVRQYPRLTNLLSVDDDIPSMHRALGPSRLEKVEDIDALIEHGFREMYAAGATLWGVYPVANPYFMKARVRTQLCYVIGSFYGMQVRNEPHEIVTVDDGEDYERSIRHYLTTGTLCRLENVASGGSSGYKGDGGMQLTRTKDRVHASKVWITETWPELARLNRSKRSGWTELRLKDARPTG